MKKGCKNKIKYPNQTSAVASLISARKKGFLGKQHQTYLCDVCNKWHIGRRKNKWKK